MWTMWHDTRYGLRMLARDPGFTAVGILTLALGIGANTALFSVISGVLLRPLPYSSPDQLMRVWSTNTQRGWTRGGSSMQDYVDWRARSQSFQEIGVYYNKSGNLTGGVGPEKVDYALVTPSLFRVFSTEPLLGRTFHDEENFPGRDNVTIVSYALWQRALGGDPGVIGKKLTLDGTELEVVGVMPPHFDAPAAGTQMWKPFGMNPDDGGPRSAHWVYALARLREGVSPDEAQAEMDTIAAVLEREHPDSNRDVGVFVEPLDEASVGNIRPALLLLWGAVGFVLLIACANTANLMLVRSSVRAREFQIKTALGARRSRLVRQILTESLLLSGLGAAGGLVLAYWGVHFLPALDAGSLPRVGEIAIDGPVLLFSLGAAVFTGLLFGLVPALRVAGAELQQASPRTASRSRPRRQRLHGALVVAEVALALVLLVGAGLLVRSFAGLLRVDVGYSTANLLTMRVEPPMTATSSGKSPEEFLEAFQSERTRIATFYEQLLDGINAVPGVRSAAAVNRLPLSGNMWGASVAVENRPISGPEDMLDAFVRVVTPQYFPTLRVPVLSGRNVRWSDDGSAPRVALVNETMARAYWPGEDPLGDRITFQLPSEEHVFWYTVVGVVGDVRHNTVTDEPRPIVYTPLAQSFFGFFGDWGMDLVVRTQADPLALVGPVRSHVENLDPDLPVFRIRSMETIIGDDVARRRFSTVLLASFALMALVLASTGIYGVLSYAIRQRTREIGIRIALGADRVAVLQMVLRQGGTIVLLGAAVGIMGAIALTRFMEGLLFQVTVTDPLTFLSASGFLIAVSLVACFVPARRATHVEPSIALRHE